MGSAQRPLTTESNRIADILPVPASHAGIHVFKPSEIKEVDGRNGETSQP